MIEILLATTSAGKLKEIRQMAAIPGVAWRSLAEFPHAKEVDETEKTFAGNARLKALGYAATCGLLTLSDDSGLEVDLLNGAPGVQSAYFAGTPRDDAANNRKLIELLKDYPLEKRTCRFRCCMAFAAPNGRLIAETEGRVEGLVIDEPRGRNGFGYDPYFLLPQRGQTTAELAPEVKNEISHRGRALRVMLTRIAEYLRSLRE